MVKCYVCGSTNTISDCMTFANEKIKIPITKSIVEVKYYDEEW